MSGSVRRWLVALVVLGTVGRVVLAFTTYGIANDIDALHLVATALRTPGSSVYATTRWPYPGGYLPIVFVADLFGRTLHLPFQGAIQLPPILGDALLTVLVAWILDRRGASGRVVVVGAAAVALGPSFWMSSGYHGQIDSVVIVPAIVGVLLWTERVSRRALWAGLLIGLAASMKQPPILLVLALVPTAESWREWGKAAVGAAAVPTLSVLPFLIRTPEATRRALTSNQGVPGFGGISAWVQPELTRFWFTLDHAVEPSRIQTFLSDTQNVVVGVSAVAAGILLFRRRTPALPAAAFIWLVVYVANANFSPWYLVWGLPFFLASGYVRESVVLQAVLFPATILLYFRLPVDSTGWTYFVAMQSAWSLLFAAFLVAARRVWQRPSDLRGVLTR